MKAIEFDLYSDISLIYSGDAFRGFFDFAVEHRMRTEAAKLQLTELNKRFMANADHMLKLACKNRRQKQPKKDKTTMQKEQVQQCYRLKSQQEYRMLREQKQEERWLLEKIN
jgi:4-alpha-glucanotransferase